MKSEVTARRPFAGTFLSEGKGYVASFPLPSAQLGSEGRVETVGSSLAGQPLGHSSLPAADAKNPSGLSISTSRRFSISQNRLPTARTKLRSCETSRQLA